jgi:hypothetical protein
MYKNHEAGRRVTADPANGDPLRGLNLPQDTTQTINCQCGSIAVYDPTSRAVFLEQCYRLILVLRPGETMRREARITNGSGQSAVRLEPFVATEAQLVERLDGSTVSMQTIDGGATRGERVEAAVDTPRGAPPALTTNLAQAVLP